jgi:polygalacturonase
VPEDTTVDTTVDAATVTQNVRSFGAKGDGTTLDTRAFQRALNACATRGTPTEPCIVVVPAPGPYLIGSIVMKSNTTLQVQTGATVQGSDDPSKYPLTTVRWEGRLVSGHRALIWSDGADNIAISGGGTIAGGATVGKLRNPRGPVLIEPNHATNVAIDNMHLTNHNVWTVHPAFANNVSITHTTITTSGGNSDGIDPDSCNHVVIDHDTINTHDDAIAIKSGRGQEGVDIGVPTTDVRISNSSLTSHFGCVTLGSEMSGGIDGVVIRNITCNTTSEAALKFKAPIGRGGFIRNIDAQGVTSRGSFLIRFTLSQGKTDSRPVTGLAGVPQLSNIKVAHSRIQGGTLADMTGHPDKPTNGITIDDITGTCAHGISIANATHVKLTNLAVTGFTPPLIQEVNVH